MRRILVLGKRHYTNKDALQERFGRIYQMPLHWAAFSDVRLWLIDYHKGETCETRDGTLNIVSAPVFGWRTLREAFASLRWRPQAVVATGDCYIGFLGWLIAKASRAPLIFDIYDKYDDFAGYRRPFGLDLFGFLRRRADARFYASQALARCYADEPKPGVDSLIANGVDAGQFRALPLADCRATLGLQPGIHIVGYFGSMEADRGVNDLIAAVARLREEHGNLYLLICGKPDPETLLSQDWIIYRGVVPHSQMPLHINACDIVALPYRRGPLMDMGASCKAAEYLMCQRPIVSSRTPNFVSNFPGQTMALEACMFECGDVEGLARALRFQLEHAITASAPLEFTWPSIADEALTAINETIQARTAFSAP